MVGMARPFSATAAVGVCEGVGDKIVIDDCPTSSLLRLGVGETTTPPRIIGVAVGVGKKETVSTCENHTAAPKITTTVTKTTNAPQN